MDHSDRQQRRDKAAKGWLSDPPSQQDRTPPSHRYKWYKMMGVANTGAGFRTGAERARHSLNLVGL